MRKAIRKRLDDSQPSWITEQYIAGKKTPYTFTEEESKRQATASNGTETASSPLMQETAKALAELEHEIFLGNNACGR